MRWQELRATSRVGHLLQKSDLPFISVVVATFARPQQLQRCLQAMTNLDYPGDRWQLIVVDDGSAEPLEPQVMQFRDRLPISCLRQNNAGAAAARNLGADAANGEYLAFTDDDCCPAPDWLLSLAQSFAEHPKALVGGLILNNLQANVFASASQLLIDYLYQYYHSGTRDGWFFASNNVSMPKAEFVAISGFDASFPRAGAEDRDLCRRWHEAGYQSTYNPTAIVYHEHSMNAGGFLRQHFNYGRGAYHFHSIKAQASSSCSGIKVEPLLFYVNLVLYPFKLKPLLTAFATSMLMFSSQMANAFGFFFERSRRSAAKTPMSLALLLAPCLSADGLPIAGLLRDSIN